ncbi:hypothetical protein [Rubritalea marina]|uniref:hypothetical protein n=1 Tax=Rubritalea marina TaxID=361055 RepID=UPI000381321F|nr:hypothetical protein [Rubritalea marina]
MRIIIITVLAVAIYFGGTFWVEMQNPEVATMTSDPLKKVAKESDPSIGNEFIGHFKLDSKSTGDWLNSQKQLSLDSRAHFVKKHQKDIYFHYDGETFYFGDNPEIAASVEIVNQTEDTLELKILDATVDHEGSLNFYLQTKGDGKIWYSNYSHMQGGKRQLYRACYVPADAE